jgi:hypothetical protein
LLREEVGGGCDYKKQSKTYDTDAFHIIPPIINCLISHALSGFYRSPLERQDRLWGYFY